ncbi:MAG: single-stranded DNA-binding protein [Candidatus Margulisbacteria bacterium]|nr:single-stranded DNA-binding protein [Candidatus Margulisiibacteriota bacterium]
MKSYNNVTLIGRATGNPDLTGAIARFELAVDRPRKDAEGKHPTDILQITASGKLAEICHDYIQKGCLVLVSGRIQSRPMEIVADSVSILEYCKEKTKGGDEN